MEIIPTILEQSEEGFIHQFTRLVPYFKLFQIDIADRDFAANDTLTVQEVNHALSLIPARLREGVTIDYHLMTRSYEQISAHCEASNKYVSVRNVLLHHNLSPDYASLSTRYPHLTFGGVVSVEDALTGDLPATPLFTLPIIQIMTVHIGVQGNPFIEEAFIKIEQLKNAGYSGKIYIDGGVNRTSLSLILSKTALPDSLCIGSFLTRSENLAETAEYLFDLLRNKQTK